MRVLFKRNFFQSEQGLVQRRVELFETIIEK